MGAGGDLQVGLAVLGLPAGLRLRKAGNGNHIQRLVFHGVTHVEPGFLVVFLTVGLLSGLIIRGRSWNAEIAFQVLAVLGEAVALVHGHIHIDKHLVPGLERVVGDIRIVRCVGNTDRVHLYVGRGAGNAFGNILGRHARRRR